MRHHRPGLIFLSKTKCKYRKHEWLKEKLNYNGVKEGADRWRFTDFYGHPETTKRKLAWDLLRRLSHESARPWLCAGDFNEILHQSELESKGDRASWQISNFRNCLLECDLNDLHFQGDMYTWCNKREFPNTIRARLDRACGTKSWALLFPQAKVINERVIGSNHSALWIDLEPRIDQHNNRQAKRFRFEALWARNAGCEQIIQQSWAAIAEATPQERCLAKLTACGEGLMEWDKNVVRNIRKQTRQLSDRIKVLQGSEINAETRGLVTSLQGKLEKLQSQEEVLWQQRAKALWLQDGDKNPAFFHARASERRDRKEIKVIFDERDRLMEGKDAVRDVVLRYFENIFQSTNREKQ
ncbi:UNVERIFIED_CONTAM: hypothetical protein Slati_1349500 [Sesamum latifolium]|uniref:Endonuclease/exonuclease/phosphatase domain-containing protein n=1 Tax=Sesamum latifolium TaxID=2727402 RepID=A0AAW2XII0_9LAMI